MVNIVHDRHYGQLLTVLYYPRLDNVLAGLALCLGEVHNVHAGLALCLDEEHSVLAGLVFCLGENIIFLLDWHSSRRNT